MADVSRVDSADYQAGRREGLAFAALAVAVAAFINLFGAEKSVVAIVLALLALRGSGQARVGSARIALGVAGVHLAIAVTAVVLLHERLAEFFHLLRTLG